MQEESRVRYLGYLLIVNPGIINIILLSNCLYLLISSGQGFYIDMKLIHKINDTHYNQTLLNKVDYNVFILSYIIFSSLCVLSFWVSQQWNDEKTYNFFQNIFYQFNSLRYAFFVLLCSLSAGITSPIELTQLSTCGFVFSNYLIKENLSNTNHVTYYRKLKLRILVILFTSFLFGILLSIAVNICNIISASMCLVLLGISLWLDARRWSNKIFSYDVGIYVGIVDMFFTITSITFAWLYRLNQC